MRYLVLDAILLNATVEDGEAVARALARLQDDDERVRGRALWFASEIGTEILGHSLKFMREDAVRLEIEWMLAVDSSDERAQDEVCTKLNSSGELARLVAAASAYRIVEMTERPLQVASLSTDKVVAGFANRRLETLQ